ncbi:MAG TPA: hypothetical protein VMG35_21655 [Bryobacteraceae bacterium]|nr:hypothetical protein [Bryobacteraceae bacterium]
MADFRKWFLAFATLVLVLGSTVPANAQAVGPQIQCAVNTSVQPTLRHEGLTELVGDIVLVCTGSPNSTGPTPVGEIIPQANISVSLGGTLSTSTIGDGLDALLLVDDPNSTQQDVCTSPTNGLNCQVDGDGGMTFKNPEKYNVFQGISGGPGTNSITFLGVPVDPPATGVRTYRITNVRIQGPSIPAGQFGLTPVYAYVSSSSSTSITITQTSQPIVGYVSNGLNFTATGTLPPFLQCQSYPLTNVGTATFMENFPSAFKIQNAVGGQTTPGQVYYSESGLQVEIPDVGTTGLASSPTELGLYLSNIPSGVQVYVDAAYTDAYGTTASLIYPTETTVGPVEVLDNETGAPVDQWVVWQITASNSSAVDTLAFNIWVAFTGTPGVNGSGGSGGSPETGVTAYAQGGFYPQNAAGWADGDPVPEFTTSLSPAAPGQSLFEVALCQTILLFPYVTDSYGFDTGIAISNTSLDNLPVPANEQAGTCSVAFWADGAAAANIGSNPDPAATPAGVATPGFVNSDNNYIGAPMVNGTGLIQPGQTWAFSVSTTDMGYNSAPGSGTTGYAIATCNFQYAHGYSFVSDTGISHFAAAYLALIIPDAPRSPEPFVCAAGFGCTGQSGEQLVH